MARIGFCAGSYESQAYSADAQKCVNLMPEKDESGAGKSEIILINTPGLSLTGGYQFPDSPMRSNGLWRIDTPGVAERAFAVSGSTLYEVFADGTFLNRGAVGNDGNPVSLTNSNIQLMIASAGQGYCLTLATNVLTGPIATIAGVVKVTYIDGFILALIGTSAQFFVSPPLDGINWDPGQTAIASVIADNIVSMDTIQRQLCLLGKKKSVCYYDSGNVFPFDVVPGGTSEQGSAATFGTTPADNTLFGIWADDKGAGVAFRAQGYTFVRISTHAIEAAWQSYPTIADAVAFSYQIGGHTIVEWYFPSAANGAGRSWCFDVSTGLWFEMGFWSNGQQFAHRACCHMYAFGKHLVGDPVSGNIYQMSFPTSDGAGGWNFVTDFGNPIRRVRRAPYVGTAGAFNFIDEFEVLADVGLGPNIPLTDGSGNFRGPQLMIRISKDGGHTWIDKSPLDMGQIGKFGTRLISRRFSGKFYGSIGLLIEVSFSDPAPLRIVDADVRGPDLPPAKRIAQKLREQA